MTAILQDIEEVYKNGGCYFESEYAGEKFKIRMNKDHSRNSVQNDDQRKHNLSLINIKYPSGKIYRTVNMRFQWQIDKVTIYNFNLFIVKIRYFINNCKFIWF